MSLSKASRRLSESFWVKPAIEILLKAYEDEPCLYDPKSEHYFNKNERNEAFNRIVEKLKVVRQVKPNDAAMKLKCLRTTFVNELNKIRKSQELGENIHQPAIWYFENMYFLKDYIQLRKSAMMPDYEKLASLRVKSAYADVTNEEVADLEQMDNQYLEMEDIDTVVNGDELYDSTVPMSSNGTISVERKFSVPINNIQSEDPEIVDPPRKRKLIETSREEENIRISDVVSLADEDKGKSRSQNNSKGVSKPAAEESKSKSYEETFGEFIMATLAEIKNKRIRVEVESEIIITLMNGRKRDLE